MTNQILLLIYLLALCTSVNAEMYKHTDKNGVTTYTDIEIEGYQEIEIPKGNTITLPKYTPKQKDSDTDSTAYTDFFITSPEQDTDIRENTGNITITLLLKPRLLTDQGHSIAIYMDNQPVIPKTLSISNTITNVDRGTHEIYAVVSGPAKKVLIQSEPVTFHLQRISIQN